ncbi:MAG TPA: thermonuclease family protein [Acetobacteraceae bacterium]|nr:thermonuclease family protein [Acetobacteraceae bacterium]
MSLHRPRRIFRSSGVSYLGRARNAGMLGMLALLVAGGGALLAARLPDPLIPAPTVAITSLDARADQVAVVDGGTLRLRDQVVQLRGVGAPERDGACPRQDIDCAAAASAMLARLIGNQPVECRIGGQDSRGRPLAECHAGRTDISRAMVESGWARAREPWLRDAEGTARASRRGIWAGAFANP